jgi:acetyl/propionyl-CoA carboxylase alpha subunit
MGDKIIAKEKFKSAGVPVVPGWSGEADVGIQRIRRQAAAIGFPVMVKAASGGGGKGMRVVLEEKDLPQALESAQREASAAFGDGRVFLEKFIARPRHVEFQVFGDSHGNVVHLFERECSIQRRHQKIIEESPSPALTPELRGKMAATAVRAAQAIGYTGAGTVEFMVDEKERGTFYFLEVNTRLQVEHPVTEMVTRHDLVRAQVLAAAGEKLPFTQDQIEQQGHALECRVYAEDPASGFLPSIGTLEHCDPPVGPNIRVDSGVAAGSEVSVYYDPMLAKVIVWGRDRAESLARMDWALSRFAVLGVTTNIEFLRRVLAHRAFQGGRTHTQFLEEYELAAALDPAIPDEVLIAAVLAGRCGSAGSCFEAARDDRVVRGGPWQAGPWRALQ